MIATLASCAAFQLPPPVPGLAARRTSAACMATGNDAVSFPELDGTDVRVGILRTRWHDGLVSELVSGVRTSLTEAKVQESNIIQYDVPGAFELPLACRCDCASPPQQKLPRSSARWMRDAPPTLTPAPVLAPTIVLARSRYLALSGTVDVIVPAGTAG